jgi:hypothetical protein
MMTWWSPQSTHSWNQKYALLRLSSHDDPKFFLWICRGMSELVRMAINESHISNLFQMFDVVTSSILKRKKWEIIVKLPEGFHAWQITKQMKTLKHAKDSSLTEWCSNDVNWIYAFSLFPLLLTWIFVNESQSSILSCFPTVSHPIEMIQLQLIKIKTLMRGNIT